MFAIHPEADLSRIHLLKYGIGYAPTMQLLLLCPEARGNETITHMHVTAYTPSFLVDLLRHPYEDRWIGAKYIQPISILTESELKLPSTCYPTLFAEYADRCLARANLAKKDRRKASSAHAQARIFAEQFGAIPKEVMDYMMRDYEKLRAQRHSQFH